MTGLDFTLSPTLTKALGWTLLHSLWQGALVAAVLFGTLLLLRHRAAVLRYRAAALALAAVVLLAAGTFARYYGAGQVIVGESVLLTAAVAPTATASTAGTAATGLTAAETARATAARSPRPATPAAALSAPATGQATGQATAAPRPLAAWLAHALLYFDRHLPLLVLAWFVGLLLMAVRLLGGLLLVQRLRRYRVQPLPAAWQARLSTLARRAGLRRPVQLLESALVRGPVVLGHLRPVVLLPLGAVAGLAPGYLEAVLAHEVAHVLRRDYLVNLLLTVAETVFFYHPAVWFMSGCLRTERENCCDDLATALVDGDALRLARALTALAEWTQAQAQLPALARTAPQLALAALGGRGSLLGRVRRLVQSRPAPTRTEGALAMALLLGSLGLLGAGATVAGPLAGQAARSWRTFTKTVTTTTKSISTKVAAAGALAANAADTTRRGPAAPLSFRPAPASAAGQETAAAGLGAAAGSAAAQQPAGGLAADDTTRRQPAGPRVYSSEPASVVITKDKKGRVKELVVNGARIEAAADAKARTGRAGQVLVVPLPPAPPRPPVPGFGENDDPRPARETARETEQEMERLSRRIERSAGQVVQADRTRNGRDEVRINLSEGALGTLVQDALALSSVAVNLGLEEASQGLREAHKELSNSLRGPAGRRRAHTQSQRDKLNQEIVATANKTARRELQQQLKSPRLATEERRAIEEALRGLDQTDRDLAEARREAGADRRETVADARREAEADRREAVADAQRQAEIDTRQAEADTRQAEADTRQAEADSRQAEVDSRPAPRAQTAAQAARRRKLQADIRAAEAELNRLDGSAGGGPGSLGLPAPPLPPRAPRYGQAPPVPPGPPAPSTTKLRDALRRDGLIGPKTTNFTFQLDDEGMRVNGQPQPAAAAEKYRRLLAPADDKGHRSTFKMSVKENSTTTTK